MHEQATNRNSLDGPAVGRAGSWRVVGIALAGAIAVAALAIAPSSERTNGSIGGATPMLIGEHSALGQRQVDDRNRALAAMPVIRGEHAGITLEDYRAESAASEPWQR